MKDISTDEDLVEVLDELKFRIKAGAETTPMIRDFNDRLNTFILRWSLDGDQHCFASLPTKPKDPCDG